MNTSYYRHDINDKVWKLLEPHLAMDTHGMPVQFFITSGTTADCTIAAQLIEGFQTEYLLADRGYGTDAILAYAGSKGMEPVIPSKKSWKKQRDYENISINCVTW